MTHESEIAKKRRTTTAKPAPPPLLLPSCLSSPEESILTVCSVKAPKSVIVRWPSSTAMSAMYAQSVQRHRREILPSGKKRIGRGRSTSIDAHPWVRKTASRERGRPWWSMWYARTA